MKNPLEWVRHFPAAVTVCDAEGIIVSMNRAAEEVFANEGGAALVGKNLFECHGAESRALLRDMIAQRRSHCYTIEKNGRRKMIYQAPWFGEDGEYGGFVEWSIVLPEAMEHHVRD